MVWVGLAVCARDGNSAAAADMWTGYVYHTDAFFFF